MLSRCGTRLAQPRSIVLFARAELVGRASLSVCEAGYRPAVLLEGSWPQSYPPGRFLSLDDRFDAAGAWIDEAADHLAQTAAPSPWLARSESPFDLDGAWLNRLGLCYYLVKLIRAAAFFRKEFPLRPGDRLDAFLDQHRDGDYAVLLDQLAQHAGAECRVHWIEPHGSAEPIGPTTKWYRRLMEWLAERVRGPVFRSGVKRVFLFGSPVRMGPVCNELTRAGASVWWLADRLPVCTWLRWALRGVGFLLCRSDLGRRNRLAFRLREALQWEQVDLTEPVAGWLSARAESEGPAQTRVADSLYEYAWRYRPHAVLVDEDATPFARAAVAVARRWGARSYVVQHGAPYCRFGFAPLAADEMLAWGSASVRQLARWGISPRRVIAAGCPALHLAPLQGGKRAEDSPRRPPRPVQPASGAVAAAIGRRAPTILMFATVPPRDGRPDALALQLTSRRYQNLLHGALEAISRLRPVELLIKRHPRSGTDAILDALVRLRPPFPVRFVSGSLRRLVARAHCVLSCMSSAGVEAAHLGVPVIELAPPGAAGLPAEHWGMIGTAHSAEELYGLLHRVLRGEGQMGNADRREVFASTGRKAARRIAEIVLENSERPGEQFPVGGRVGREAKSVGSQQASNFRRRVGRAA